jgi:L-aminopeptidase/D-esterase-like protein
VSAASGPAVDLAPFGLLVGHAADAEGATGCTVFLARDRALRAAHALVGRASASRELAAASPDHLVGRADAVFLTGGSAYGLDAAAGVMRWLEARGRGFPVGAGVVPIVPAAALFDLLPLGRFDRRPTPAMAAAACDAARPVADAHGSVGAGTGATVGKALGAAGAMKGGFGAAAAWEGEAGAPGALGVAAAAAVNAFGDVRDAAGRVLAGARLPDGAFAADAAGGAHPAGPRTFAQVAAPAPGAAPNTTLCVVAASAPLDGPALANLARAAAAALYRRVTPVGTAFDGDVVFALCPDGPGGADAAAALRLEALAVRALEEAIERAVRHAAGREGVPGLADA